MPYRDFDPVVVPVHRPVRSKGGQPKPVEAFIAPVAEREPVDRVPCRAGNNTCATAHASTLNRATGSQPARAPRSLLKLQKRFGNRYVERVLALARENTRHKPVARNQSPPTIEWDVQRVPEEDVPRVNEHWQLWMDFLDRLHADRNIPREVMKLLGLERIHGEAMAMPTFEHARQHMNNTLRRIELYMEQNGLAGPQAQVGDVDKFFPDNFDEGGMSFRQSRSGQRNAARHSAPRHCAEYLRDAPRQQLRMFMANVRLYTVGEYARNYRVACARAAANPHLFGQAQVVTDNNNKLWTIIIARREQGGTFVVRHAHLENYQND